MKGSRDNQPPKFTPLTGKFAYEPHELEIGGVLEFALFESSHVEFNPITGNPPTVSFVYVTLKSVVSYQVHGSRYVPLAAAGRSVSDMPFKFEFDGFPLSFVVEPELASDELLCFLLTTTATIMIMSAMTAPIPIHIPGDTNQSQSLGCHVRQPT
jgi:hypothetical protein